ncbi:MAG: tyrosine-type recombinase/integrase [bacterium]|nr:tyrosine-type recombinase/integrase [bacterium]
MIPHLKDFLKQLEDKKYSNETIYNYERDLVTFENFIHSSGLKFENVTKETIKSFKFFLLSNKRFTSNNAPSEKKLSTSSINRILSSFKSYLKFLIDINCKTPITADSLKLIKNEKKHGQVPEMNDLINLIESPTKFEKEKNIALRNRAMLETLFATGMRISELLSLKREQLDKSGRIYILGKGKKQRFVHLTPRAINHLQLYLKTRVDTSPYVFIPYRGRNNQDKQKKISTNYLQYKIKKYRELLHINIPVSAHSLRYGFATYLAENGANPAAIQILLGHESLDTTTRYVHASDRYAEKVHTKFHPLKQ